MEQTFEQTFKYRLLAIKHTWCETLLSVILVGLVWSIAFLCIYFVYCWKQNVPISTAQLLRILVILFSFGSFTRVFVLVMPSSIEFKNDDIHLHESGYSTSVIPSNRVKHIFIGVQDGSLFIVKLKISNNRLRRPIIFVAECADIQRILNNLCEILQLDHIRDVSWIGAEGRRRNGV